MVLMLEIPVPSNTKYSSRNAITSSSNPTSKPHFSSSTKSQCCSNSSSTVPCRKLPLPAHTPNFKERKKKKHTSPAPLNHKTLTGTPAPSIHKPQQHKLPLPPQTPNFSPKELFSSSPKSQLLTGIPAPSPHKVQQHKLPPSSSLSHNTHWNSKLSQHTNQRSSSRSSS